MVICVFVLRNFNTSATLRDRSGAEHVIKKKTRYDFSTFLLTNKNEN